MVTFGKKTAGSSTSKFIEKSVIRHICKLNSIQISVVVLPAPGKKTIIKWHGNSIRISVFAIHPFSGKSV